ncbi:MAG: hypothetical protein IT516_16645 [Burkholderiales bacterium]|nr:hypothetical protein [Burkholderiales bacterium]
MRQTVDPFWFACGVCLTLGILAAPIASAQRLIVVASAPSEPYQRAAEGMTQLGVPVERFLLAPDQERAVMAAIRRNGRDTAIVALGAAAAETVAHAKSAPNGSPIVNCMVLDDTPATTGTVDVPLTIPAQVAATWIRRLLPQTHTVGILYDPVRSEARAADSAAAMASAGLDTVREAVPNPATLPVALQRMQDHADALFALPDPTIYTQEHARALLLFSFRHRIPLVGPTESWVKAGALFAVDWDYTDLGRYCGALALRKLAGATTTPRPARTRVTANRRTAEQLSIHWDAEQLRLIDKLYP